MGNRIYTIQYDGIYIIESWPLDKARRVGKIEFRKDVMAERGLGLFLEGKDLMLFFESVPRDGGRYFGFRVYDVSGVEA